LIKLRLYYNEKYHQDIVDYTVLEVEQLNKIREKIEKERMEIKEKELADKRRKEREQRIRKNH